jgi:chemotaxis protein MotB
MIGQIRRHLIIGSLISALGLTGCVSQGKYDDLQARYEQLQAQNQQLEYQIARLRGAIKYTVNSDLLFPSGGWEMSAQGKQVIAKMASKLAPTQQNKIMVNGYTDDAPVGPKLQQEGITSNEILSQKRAENVMEFLIAQGLDPGLVEAHGFGDAQPVASNDTAKGRAANRRVELTVAPDTGSRPPCCARIKS